MPLASDLMGVGMPAAQAARLGGPVGSIIAAGTAQTGGTPVPLGQYYNLVSAASSQTGIVLPANTALAMPYWFFVTSSTSAVIYPETGSSIDGGTATTGGITIAQNKGVVLMRVSATAWRSVTGA